jgi:hypothetical protein
MPKPNMIRKITLKIVGLHPQGVGRGRKGLKPQQHTLRDEAANPTYEKQVLQSTTRFF